eukprot:scaffold1449_cov244-Pinguiococcus_pyrenoidosus.AAC.5
MRFFACSRCIERYNAGRNDGRYRGEGKAETARPKLLGAHEAPEGEVQERHRGNEQSLLHERDQRRENPRQPPEGAPLGFAASARHNGGGDQDQLCRTHCRRNSSAADLTGQPRRQVFQQRSEAQRRRAEAVAEMQQPACRLGVLLACRGLHEAVHESPVLQRQQPRVRQPHLRGVVASRSAQELQMQHKGQQGRRRCPQGHHADLQQRLLAFHHPQPHGDGHHRRQDEGEALCGAQSPIAEEPPEAFPGARVRPLLADHDLVGLLRWRARALQALCGPCGGLARQLGARPLGHGGEQAGPMRPQPSHGHRALEERHAAVRSPTGPEDSEKRRRRGPPDEDS